MGPGSHHKATQEAWLARATSTSPTRNGDQLPQLSRGRGAHSTLHQVNHWDQVTPRKRGGHPCQTVNLAGQVLQRGSSAPALVLGRLQTQTNCPFRCAPYMPKESTDACRDEEGAVEKKHSKPKAQGDAMSGESPRGRQNISDKHFS